jgi:hypothetical protein
MQQQGECMTITAIAIFVSLVLCLCLGAVISMRQWSHQDVQAVYDRGFERCKAMALANRPCLHCQKMPLEHNGVYCTEPAWSMSSRQRTYVPDEQSSKETTHA